jgi:hypothetical protein
VLNLSRSSLCSFHETLRSFRQTLRSFPTQLVGLRLHPDKFNSRTLTFTIIHFFATLLDHCSLIFPTLFLSLYLCPPHSRHCHKRCLTTRDFAPLRPSVNTPISPSLPSGLSIICPTVSSAKVILIILNVFDPNRSLACSQMLIT